jgi:hypothetical protein
MLKKHPLNPDKSVLIYPGRWSSLSADSIARDILESSPLSVFCAPATLSPTHQRCRA